MMLQVTENHAILGNVSSDTIATSLVGRETNGEEESFSGVAVVQT